MVTEPKGGLHIGQGVEGSAWQDWWYISADESRGVYGGGRIAIKVKTLQPVLLMLITFPTCYYEKVEAFGDFALTLYKRLNMIKTLSETMNPPLATAIHSCDLSGE